MRHNRRTDSLGGELEKNVSDSADFPTRPLLTDNPRPILAYTVLPLPCRGSLN